MIFDILQCGKPTDQNVIFPFGVIRRECDRVQELITNKSFMGELGPVASGAKGMIQLQNASHIVNALWLDKNGTLQADIEPINTPMGRFLKGLIETDPALVKFSPVGVGGLPLTPSGTHLVGYSYRLTQIEALASQSNKKGKQRRYRSIDDPWLTDDVRRRGREIDAITFLLPGVFAANEYKQHGDTQQQLLPEHKMLTWLEWMGDKQHNTSEPQQKGL